MPNKSWWQVPFEPQMQQMLTVLLLPPLYGISSPNFVLPRSILAGTLTSVISTLIVCGWSYGWLRLGAKQQKAVQQSHAASDARQSMGYGPFALRLLLLLLWMLGAFMGSALWVVFRWFNGSAPPLTLCLVRALIGATVVVLGLFVQAVALDRHYQTKP